MKKFWKWKNQTVTNQETQEQTLERTLFLNGTIAEESWFDDDITPKLFRDELFAGNGDITIWINSPGGDCVAAAQIYNMMMEYPGNVTVKIDGIAASAASVIAMAGTKVLVSPVSMLMIHNPMTAAMGDTSEMQKAITMLDEVKESIINAYEIKTGMSRAKLSHLMDKVLGYAVHTSAYAPENAIAFGDYSYYNIGDRGTRSFKQLTELFAGNGMIGYVAKERVDGKLILPEAVQILKLSGSSKG